MVLLAAFFRPSGEPCEWSGVLMEPWPTSKWLCVWLYSSVVLDNDDLCCTFPVILASFES